MFKTGDEIQAIDKQNEILLSISYEIVRSKGKEDLLHIIRDTIKKYIYFDDGLILRYNKINRTCRSYIYHAAEGRSKNPGYKNHIDLEYPVTDNSIENSTYPIVYDIEAMLPYGDDQISFMHNAGIKKFVSIKLIEGNELIGLLVLLSERKDSFSASDLDLLQKISSLISIATANIIANEEIAVREEEKTILLSLSLEIAALKKRDDLFQVVNTKIKKILSINDFGIAKINEDRKTYSSFMLDLENTIKDHSEFEEITSDCYDITDSIFSQVMNSIDPVLLVVDEITNIPGLPAYVDFWKKIGVQYVVAVPLRVGGINIGCAFVLTDSITLINRKCNLLKGICAELSVAISNILANEEILRREKERELLLSLNSDIAVVRNHEDLLMVINQRLKILLSFSHTLINIINEDKISVSNFLFNHTSKSKDIYNCYDFKTGYLINDGVMNKAFSNSDPLVYKFYELKEKLVLPFYLKVNLESGIEQASVIRLLKAGKVFGFWMIFFEKRITLDKSMSNLIKGLANQVSIAVSNIIANQEIQKAESEKTKLISFGNAMASVRDKVTLATILKQQLQDLFTIDNYIINVLTSDKKKYYPLLFYSDSTLATLPGFLEMMNSKNDVNDGISNKILESESPVNFNIEDWFHLPEISSYAKAVKAMGAEKITGVRIRLGEENIGFITFNQIDSTAIAVQESLFRSVCSQIAITIINILANEKVNAQLTEINEYKQLLEEEQVYLKEEIKTTQNFTEMIGESEEMKKIFRLVDQVAPTDSTVLILGETGTGKELIARAIHNSSPRKNKLMVKVNCAALPIHLIESELFGHERGSFTGAVERRIGKFELANNGTLFLDEIGEMPLDLQVKLLRALQEKEIERVGGKITIKVDVRIIAATNRDLEKMMGEGKFRNDLYYRLNIFPINLPPLRNRREDIPSLALHFVRRFSKKAGKQINSFNNRALMELVQYNWPGNIRELEHLIERSVLLANSGTIKEIHIPSQKNNLVITAGSQEFIIKTIDENERDYILKILKYVKGRIAGEGGAAALLGLPPSTLNSRMKRLGIRKEHFG